MPVVLPPDVVANPQLDARRFFEPLEHTEAGEHHYAGLPFPPPAELVARFREAAKEEHPQT